MKKCIKCNAEKEIHQHHIVYSEQPVYLCKRCHAVITGMNVFVSRKLLNKLTNTIRNKIWLIFLQLPIGKKHNIVKTFQRQMRNRFYVIAEKPLDRFANDKKAVRQSKKYFKNVIGFS